MTYADFLASKTRRAQPIGQHISPGDVHPMLHEWQARIVAWAVRTGRAAIWSTTGTGKTRMQLAWADHIGQRVLVLAPLAVCQQTVREAAALGMTATYVRSDVDADGPGIWVTNYEMADRFDPAGFDAVVLDESSCLKNSDGKLRSTLISRFRYVKYRLACSATPAPNDLEELTNQAEFLGVMPRVEMLAAYYVNDGKSWRLKGHARGPMFRWMASWAIALQQPSDISGDDTGYVLPGLNVVPHLLPVNLVPDGQLFATELGGVTGRAKIRRATLEARCARTAELVAAEPAEPWVLWCGLNSEADRLAELIPGAVNVHGSMSPEEKAAALLAFADGDIKTLITKPSIASLGLNWQHCARMAFVGLNDSYEAYFQAIRRCLRYGQTRVVHAHVVLSELEAQIASNIARKEHEADAMTESLVREMRTATQWSAA